LKPDFWSCRPTLLASLLKSWFDRVPLYFYVSGFITCKKFAGADSLTLSCFNSLRTVFQLLRRQQPS